ncbi:hypothetical protein K449DRAFT_464431 [Hypoxylon sp. EC38]|nr:hypothetical protein K449DRAFT_464431 [Hypoxylon sp. EC38]
MGISEKSKACVGQSYRKGSGNGCLSLKSQLELLTLGAPPELQLTEAEDPRSSLISNANGNDLLPDPMARRGGRGDIKNIDLVQLISMSFFLSFVVHCRSTRHETTQVFQMAILQALYLVAIEEQQTELSWLDCVKGNTTRSNRVSSDLGPTSAACIVWGYNQEVGIVKIADGEGQLPVPQISTNYYTLYPRHGLLEDFSSSQQEIIILRHQCAARCS